MATANIATTTASPNPTAQANASLSANANIPAGQAGSPWTAATTADPGLYVAGTRPAPAPVTSTPQASTTVQSNDNTINHTVPAITNTTNNLANTSGVSTNSSGQPTYSNGTLVQPPAGETYVNGQLTYTGTNGTGTNNNISPTGTLITGGYIGDTYYAPGTLAANIPTDANGQPQELSPQGSTVSQNLANLQTAKSQADSLTASLIDSITSQYNSLIQNQQQANNSQQATVGHSLIKEGTSQLDPIGAAQVTQAQVSYGLSQIASLQSKEQSAIIQAQQAGQDEDFKLMDEMNTLAQSVRTEQQNAAQKILDAVSAVNAQQAQVALQQKQDLAIGNLYSQGVTDPTQIINTLTKAGMTVDASEVSTAIAALNPDQKDINSIATTAAQAGASQDTISQIMQSKTSAAAITLATPALGAKWASDQAQQKFTDNIALQNLHISQADLGIKIQQLKDSENAASQAAGNAVITTPSGKGYVDGTNLDAAATTAAIKSGLPVLKGTDVQAINSIQNVQGQVSTLLASLQTAGVIDKNGNFTGKTPGNYLTHLLDTGSSKTLNTAVNNFGTSIKSMVTDLQKLPDTGQLVATLQDNIPNKTTHLSDLQTKITNITNALESSENSILSNGNVPQQVILNGKTLNLQPDGTYQ